MSNTLSYDQFVLFDSSCCVPESLGVTHERVGEIKAAVEYALKTCGKEGEPSYPALFKNLSKLIECKDIREAFVAGMMLSEIRNELRQLAMQRMVIGMIGQAPQGDDPESDN